MALFRLLLFLQEILEDVVGLRVRGPVVGDDGAGAAHDLSGLSLLVDLAEAAVFSKLLACVDHDEVHGALFAERTHELCVLRIVAVGGEAAELRLLLVECLGTLVKAAAQAVFLEGCLKYNLKGIKDVHFFDFDLLFTAKKNERRGKKGGRGVA